MDIERIREVRLAHPFKPFYLIMNDGRRLPVERAIYLGISPTKKFLVYSPPEGGFDFIGVNDISDVLVDENMDTVWMRKLKHG